MNSKHDKLIWNAVPTLFDVPNKPTPVTGKQQCGCVLHAFNFRLVLSIIVTGATFSEVLDRRDGRRLRVGLYRFSPMWWIYFHKGAETGSEEISRSSEPGRLARIAYTYLHMPIVAGIIVAAVADELVLKHPGGHSDLKTVLSAIGGPLLFLLRTILFKHTIRGFLQLSHGAGIIALGILAWFAGGMSPLLLSILTTVIMVIVAAWESKSLKSGAPGPGRSLIPGPPEPDFRTGRPRGDQKPAGPEVLKTGWYWSSIWPSATKCRA